MDTRRIFFWSSSCVLFGSVLLEGVLAKPATQDIPPLEGIMSRVVIFGPITFAVLWLAARARLASPQKLADKDANNWAYAAEGALNVAVRYKGDVKTLQGKVLRLRKRPKLSRVRSSRSHSSDFDVLDEDNDPSVDVDLEETMTDANKFVDTVMVPLLTRRFVPPSHIVRIDTKFIDELSKSIDPMRPEKRREVAGLHRGATVGLLMRDSAKIACGCSKDCPTYCFEIKPKWGFLSIESKEWPVKRRVDRFTMHQHLKKQTDTCAKISEYCPLEMFHGGKDGIKSSLFKLEKTPQNNLRLFIDGTLKFPVKCSDGSSSLSSILGSDSLKEELFDALAESLDQENLFSRILDAQTLGPLNDIEIVYPIYKELIDAGYEIPNIHLGYDPDYQPQFPPKSVEDRIEIVRRFLISCTARDCSVMAAFSSCRFPPKPSQGKCLNGKWSYELTIVDLDAKPISKMQHYYTVDREIAMNYTEKVEGVPTRRRLDGRRPSALEI